MASHKSGQPYYLFFPPTLLEDVGVTAYAGAAPLLKQKEFVEAAGILAVGDAFRPGKRTCAQEPTGKATTENQASAPAVRHGRASMPSHDR
jgi:hypothetical protein